MSPATCPPLDLPDELMASSDNRTAGAVVTFHCKHGWHVDQDIAIVCFPDGSWNAPIPACVEGGIRIRQIATLSSNLREFVYTCVNPHSNVVNFSADGI